MVLLLDDGRIGDELAPLLLEDEPEPPDNELGVFEGVVVVVVCESYFLNYFTFTSRLFKFIVFK